MHGPIERGRLRGQFRACAGAPVTAVLAPAGCGKSIALTQYLAGLDETVLRYDVRPEHGTLLGFARGFADVVFAAAPEARGTVGDAVAAAVGSESPGQTLSLWMSNHLRGLDAVIAIDDFHHAEADPRCAEFLAALIARTKDRLRWIIAARSAQHLPLSSWLVYGDASMPIGEDDLRFTADDAAEAAQLARSTLLPEDVDRLLQTTGGWATAFMLALRVAEFSGDVHGAAATARQLSYEYLADQVYRTLSLEERDVLAVSALLPEIDVGVLERAGFDRAHVILDGLQRRASFLAGDGRRYRCHSLFRDFLNHELELRGEEASRTVHLRAANALRASGDIIAALHLFAKAHATADTLALLAEHGFALSELAHGDAVQAAIDSLPEAERSGNPVVVGLRAQLERVAGRFEDAAALFERAIAASDDTRFRAVLLARLGAVMVNIGRDPSPLLQGPAYDHSLPTSLRLELLSILGVALGLAGRHDGLSTLLDEVEASERLVDSEMSRSQILHQLGTAAMVNGDSVRAGRVLTRAADLATSQGLFKLASLAYTSLSSNASTNEDDLPKALFAAQRAGDRAAACGELFLGRYALARQIDLSGRRGDRDEVDRLVGAYYELPGPDLPNALNAVRWTQGMAAAWDGNWDEACALQLDVSHRVGQFPEEAMLMRAFAALYLQAAGRRAEALEMVQATLEHMKSPSPRASFGRNREFSRALCALTEALAGRTNAAERLLQKKPLVVTARTSAMLDCVAAVLRDLRAGVVTGDLTQHYELMDAHWIGGWGMLIASALQRHDRLHAQTVRLTPAEQHVFRALADGRTPKEIAATIGCSIHTVRWHIRQTIAKLECSGSEQALRVVLARGLLDGR